MAIVVSIIMSVSIFMMPVNGESSALNYQAKEVIQSAVFLFNETGSVEQTEKVALVEMFTATWCVVCAVTEPVMNDLSGEYSSKLAVLEYYTSGDIFGTPGGSLRMNEYYNADTFPTVMFDGVIKKVGAESLDEDLHTTYGNYIKSRLDRISPVIIDINGAITGTSGRVNVTYETQGYFSNELRARIVVFEDNIHYNGSNGITDHRFVVREILSEEGIVINRSADARLERDFLVEVDWNVSKMGVVAFVQSDSGTRYADSLSGFNQGNDQSVVWIMIIMVLVLVSILLIAFLRRKKKKAGNDSIQTNGRSLH